MNGKAGQNGIKCRHTDGKPLVVGNRQNAIAHAAAVPTTK